MQGEVEVDGFLVEGGGELRAEVGASVGCVNDYGEFSGAGLGRATGNIYTLCGGCGGKNEAGTDGRETVDGSERPARADG